MGFTKRNKKKVTKRNEILLLKKQNETKRNEISLFLLFRETSEISRNKFFVSLCFVFRETKKMMRNGNPTCFASKRNFAKQQVCFAKHETCFVLCFAKYETKLVSLETLYTVDSYVKANVISLLLKHCFSQSIVDQYA
jgi:hypothetical protein